MKKVFPKLSFIYLLAVPVLATALAFIIGHQDYKIYLPFWLLNGILMFAAINTLSRRQDASLASASSFLIYPWILFAIFGGMGPPPETAPAWADIATEQVIRYTILIAGGICMGVGFYRAKKAMEDTPGARYAKIANLLFAIALPLFVCNMAYWGYFLTDVFVTYSVPGAPAKPGWITTVGEAFTLIRKLEVTLIYLATALLAASLMQARQLSKTGAYIYISFACLAAIFNLLPGTLSSPLGIANYLSYIPAFTLLMPYYIGVNLLARPASVVNSA